MSYEVFKAGERVVATCNYMHQITEGKTYEVVEYIERCVTPTFTWPPYVTVLGDFGKPVTGHTHRFRREQPAYKPSRPCTAHDQLAGGQCGNCLKRH